MLQMVSNFKLMKTNIQKFLLILMFTALSSGIYAQKKEIKVQIMHNDEIILDTTLYKTSAEAKKVIINLVEQFSTDKVTINTKITHGLYVFNITNDNWKESEEKKKEKTDTIIENKNNNKPVEITQHTNTSDIDVDSLFKEFSDELDMQWKVANIEVIIDSIGNAFNTIKGDFINYDFENDPGIQNLKTGFNDLLEIIKTTRIIIIQEGDTIKID